jgi:nucleoside-diphosphate-sugar epimerase
MRILITGAAGFLGSHLCDRLLADGHEIIGMDNFITGNPQNIAHLSGHPRFSFQRHDVSNYIFVAGKVDAVLHFASPASPNPNSKSGYFNLPIQTMKAGALGTHNTLGVAKAHGAKFLLASTSEIYGDPTVHPQTEDYPGNVDPLGCARSMTKPNASPNRSRWHTTATTAWIRASYVSSTPTVRAWIWTTGAPYPTSLSKPAPTAAYRVWRRRSDSLVLLCG